MVFQQFNLWPHMTALRNVTEALVLVKRLPLSTAEKIGRAMLAKVGLAEKADAYPNRPVRRAAAACRHRARARDGAASDALRRGHLSLSIRSWSVRCSAS